ncbi:MAG: methyltransferase domain-containing protein [Saprospiraceae bacterium]|nr:methyltransferase domain-containing protein [Saprospiraceae bacterium]
MALFDDIAATYDKEFTFTAVGKAQRLQVYHHIDGIISAPKSLDILELNCGTGEDALYFSSKGHRITATDISVEMLEVLRSKIVAKKEKADITVKQLDIKEIGSFYSEKSFDVVFSNFGGLNCLNPEEINQLSQNLPQLLKPGGTFIAVVMPELCLWESIYFLLKLRFADIFRRKKKFENASISNHVTVPTFYYAQGKLENLFSDQFKKESIAPVGFFIPPSYLNSIFQTRPLLVKALQWLDLRLPKSSFFASASDHFIVCYKLKSTKI